MNNLDLLCLALFDKSQQQNVFERLNQSMNERKIVQEETKKLKSASDQLESEILALDEQRTATSKMIDAALPPEAKQAAETQFHNKFNSYFDGVKKIISKQMMDARELEVQTALKLAKAQEIELQTIASLK